MNKRFLSNEIQIFSIINRIIKQWVIAVVASKMPIKMKLRHLTITQSKSNLLLESRHTIEALKQGKF